MTPRAADGLHEKYRFPIPGPEPGMVRILIFGESIKIWPLHCQRGWKCQQCFIEGKMRCDPRFWGEGFEDLHGEVWRQCIWCDKLFPARVDELKRGWGHFCSQHCVIMTKFKFGILKGARHQGQMVPCDYCGKLKYKPNCEIKRCKFHFCDVECKNQWQGKNYGFGSKHRKDKELVAVG